MTLHKPQGPQEPEVPHHALLVDGDEQDMTRAIPFLRSRAIRALRMLAPFKVQMPDCVQEFAAGDWLCEQGGVRWGVREQDFGALYEPAMMDEGRSPWKKKR